MAKPAKTDYEIVLMYWRPIDLVPGRQPGEWTSHGFDEVAAAFVDPLEALQLIRDFILTLGRRGGWKPHCWVDEKLAPGERRATLEIGVPDGRGLNYARVRAEFVDETVELMRVLDEHKARVKRLGTDVRIQDTCPSPDDEASLYTKSPFVKQFLQKRLGDDARAKVKRPDVDLIDERGVHLRVPGAADTRGFAFDYIGLPEIVVGRIKNFDFVDGTHCTMRLKSGKSITVSIPAGLYEKAAELAQKRRYATYLVKPRPWASGGFEYIDVYDLVDIAPDKPVVPEVKPRERALVKVPHHGK
jgi:hypothetical protein